MKHCVNCGTEMADGINVCASCGHEAVATTPEAATKQDAATAPVTLSTVMGIATLLYPMGIPALVMSIIGVVLGSKEKKATGKSLGLVLNIISLVLTSLGLLGIIAYLVLYFLVIFGMLAGGAF